MFLEDNENIQNNNDIMFEEELMDNIFVIENYFSKIDKLILKQQNKDKMPESINEIGELQNKQYYYELAYSSLNDLRVKSLNKMNLNDYKLFIDSIYLEKGKGFYKELILNSFNNIKNYPDINKVQESTKGSLSLEEKYNIINDYINSLSDENKDKINNIFLDKVRDYSLKNNVTDLKELKKQIQYINNNIFSLEDDINKEFNPDITIIEDSYKKESIPSKEKIDQLIKNHSDIEELNDLYQILSYGNSLSSDLISKKAERTGSLGMALQSIKDQKYLNETLKIDKKYIKINRDKTYNIDYTLNKDFQKSDYDNALENDIKLDDTQKKILTKIYKILNNQDKLETFSSLIKKREIIEKEVSNENKNINLLTSHIFDYHNLEKQYLEVEKMFNEYKPSNESDLYPNSTNARVANIPLNIRKNNTLTTYFNLVSQGAKILNKYNIAFDEFLDKPQNTVKKITGMMMNNSKTNELIKNGSIETCFSLMNDNVDFMEDIHEDINNNKDLTILYRLIGSLPYLNKDLDKRTEDNYRIGTMSQLLKSASEINDTSFQFSNENTQKDALKRLIYTEPADRDIYKLTNTKLIDPRTNSFNEPIDSYLKSERTNIDNVALRMVELYLMDQNKAKGFENYRQVLSAIATDLLNDKDIEKPKFIKNILKNIEKGTVEKISKDNFDLLKTKEKIFNGLNENNKETIKSIIELENNYYKKNIFVRIFSNDARKMGNIVSELEKKAIEKFGKDEYKTIKEDYKNNKESKTLKNDETEAIRTTVDLENMFNEKIQNQNKQKSEQIERENIVNIDLNRTNSK